METQTILKRVELNQALISNLQKNNNLNNYKAFTKLLFKLTERLTEIEKLTEELKRPADQVFNNKENQKNSLIYNFKHVAGILKLVEGKRSKKVKKIYQSDKKLQKISDKQLINVSKSALAFANKLGGYSIDGINKISTKAMQNKFEKAKMLAEELGLTHDKVKKLEEATLNFARVMVEAGLIKKEKSKFTERITKLLDSNDRLFERRVDKFVEVYEKPGSSFLKTYNSLRFPTEPGDQEKSKKKDKKAELV